MHPTGFSPPGDVGGTGFQVADLAEPPAADRAVPVSGGVRRPGTMDAAAARAGCEFMSSSNRP
ncbi:hypothetical protein GCM10010272_52620 [Streptomyces lateritius]|nr:hypothetical protein GCM10010272_52620 [Streptomyces lateritius]